MSSYTQKNPAGRFSFVEAKDSDRTPLFTEEYGGTSEDPYKAYEPPNLWFRTFMIGVFFMVLSLAIVGGVLYWYVWISIALMVVVPFALQYLAPPMFGCAYSVCKNDEWVFTVRRVAFWGLLFGAIAACVGGYYAREWWVIQYGKEFSNLSTVQAPSPDFGSTTSFVPGATPHGASGGRALAFGFYPICVAPLAETGPQKIVSYWAVGSGICCTKQPMNCDKWTLPFGAARLKYTEFYHGLSDAVKDAVGTFGLQADPKAVFVTYGDPDDIKFVLKRNFALAFCIPVVVGFIFMLYRSIKGPYESQKLL